MSSANLTANQIVRERSHEDLALNAHLAMPKSKVLEDTQDSELLVDVNNSHEVPTFWSGKILSLLRNIFSLAHKNKKRIFPRTVTARESAIYTIADESVDPLQWDGPVEWRWFTGIIMYTTYFFAPLAVGFTASYILQIRDSDEDPSSWWKCGLYCSFVWMGATTCYNFTIVRACVRMHPLFLDFNPSWRLALYTWFTCGIINMSFWIGIYAMNGALWHLHGPLSTLFSILLLPVLMSKMMVPEIFTTRALLKVIVVTSCSIAVFHIMQGISLILVLQVYLASGSHPFVILLFFVLQVFFDQCAEKLCKLTENSSLRIIFLNNNELVRQLVLCWALAKAESIAGVLFASCIEILTTLGFLMLICGPLTLYTKPTRIALSNVFGWIVGRENVDEKSMTKKEKVFAIGERAKWTYFFSLYLFGEIILAPWQIVFYGLFNSTFTKKAYFGFEKVTNGWFPIINHHALLLTVSISATVNLGNLILFTYCVRKKFPAFSPFRFLNILLRKYNTLLGLSVFSICQSIQCLMLIDCKFDDLTIIWYALKKLILGS